MYRDLLELYYDTEKPLNSDTARLARRVLATTDEEREALELVLEEFFDLQEDGWHNERCDAEIAKYLGQIEQASRAGKASAAKRYGKKPTNVEPLLTPVERPFNQPEPEPEPFIEAKASLSSADADDTESGAKLPACPHREILALFAERLPELPQPRAELWDGARAQALAARWKWVLTATKGDGARYATTKAEAIGFFDRLFTYVAECPHLVGKNNRQWTADMAWLVKAENFSKVLQGNYEAREAA